MSALSPQSVIVDGEAVTFEGPPPSNPLQLYQLIDQALLGNGRLIASFLVDGTDAQKDPSVLERAGYTDIEASSVDWQQACKNALARSLPAAEQAATDLIAYGSAMLAVPLLNSVREVNTAAEKMASVLTPFETAQQFATQFQPTWAETAVQSLQRSNQACDQFTQSLKNQDIGSAAEALVIELPDAFIEFKNIPTAPWAS